MGRIGLVEGIYPLTSPEETIEFGRTLAKTLPQNAILAITGKLGAGKTTFVQGLAQGLNIVDPVQSPTFVLLNLYQGLAHFDLYRLKNTNDFLSLGFDEYFAMETICAIEWPERILSLLPNRTIHLHFQYDRKARTVEVRP